MLYVFCYRPEYNDAFTCDQEVGLRNSNDLAEATLYFSGATRGIRGGNKEPTIVKQFRSKAFFYRMVRGRAFEEDSEDRFFKGGRTIMGPRKQRRGILNIFMTFLLVATVGTPLLSVTAFAESSTGVVQEEKVDLNGLSPNESLPEEGLPGADSGTEEVLAEEKALSDEEKSGAKEEFGVQRDAVEEVVLAEGEDPKMTDENIGKEDRPILLNAENGLFGAELPDAVKNLTWNMYKASDNTEPDRDKGLDPLDYESGFTNYETVYVVMNFTIEAPLGSEFQSGDTVRFPFLPGRDIGVNNTAAEKLIASDGTTILGTWMISDRVLVIELGEGATGKTTLNNCVITTAKTLHPYNQSVAATVKTFTIGGVDHSYKIHELTRKKIGSYMDKGFSSATNQSLRWLIGTGAYLVDDLTRSEGASMRNVSSLVFEDEIPASEASLGISAVNITARVPFIMGEDDLTAASASGTTLLEANATGAFTEVRQTPSDTTYEAFKNRVGPFQYGTYDLNDGGHKFIINFGDPSAVGQGPTYSDLFGDLEQRIMDANKGVSVTEAKIISNALGDDNCIGGNIVYWMFYITTEYKQTCIDMPKTNTGELTYVLEGSSLTETDTAQGILRTGSAVATPSVQRATIISADNANGTSLKGVVYKVQKKNEGENVWEDTGYQPVTTDSNGQATTETLESGTYRLVPVSGLEGYNVDESTYSSSTNEPQGEFTVSPADDRGVVVTAKNVPYFYAVNYNVDGAEPIPAKAGVRYGDAGLLPPSDPQKQGSEFSSWVVEYSGPEGKWIDLQPHAETRYSEVSDNEEVREITLKALYVEKEYEVHYDMNGATSSALPSLEKVKWGDRDLIPDLPPEKEGSLFAGWTVLEGGEEGALVSTQEAYSDLVPSDQVSSLVLQAQWTPRQYEVWYDIDGGSSGIVPPRQGVLWGEGGLLPEADPTKEGVVFVGWVVIEGGVEGMSVSPDSLYRDIASGPDTERVTLQAVWAVYLPDPDIIEDDGDPETPPQEDDNETAAGNTDGTAGGDSITRSRLLGMGDVTGISFLAVGILVTGALGFGVGALRQIKK